MRTKVLLCAAALAVGALYTQAQSNVYSLNVVGYVNVTVSSNNHTSFHPGYTLTANQLVQTNSQVQTLFATVPDKTQIIGWTGTAFAPDNWDGIGMAWDDGTESYVPGQGFFIHNFWPTNFTVTFVGDVSQAANTTTFTGGQYKLVGLWTPQAGLLQTDFGYNPSSTSGLVPTDYILQWTGAAYATTDYDPTIPGWDPAEPVIAVGDGFFVKPQLNNTWSRQFTVP